MERSPHYLNCPLCGMEFEKVDTVCAHSCPLGKGCRHVRCPNCDYEFADSPRAFGWVQRLWRKRRAAPVCNGDSVSLERLDSGDRGILVRLDPMGRGRRNSLTVFGLTPGIEVTVLQRRPSFVIRVDETELGLDREIARQIWVKPV